MQKKKLFLYRFQILNFLKYLNNSCQKVKIQMRIIINVFIMIKFGASPIIKRFVKKYLIFFEMNPA
jgi:hypothetical protein